MITQTVRTNGQYAYTITEVSDIDAIPYYYLCSLADATGYATPDAAFKHYPELFAPISLI